MLAVGTTAVAHNAGVDPNAGAVARARYEFIDGVGRTARHRR